MTMEIRTKAGRFKFIAKRSSPITVIVVCVAIALAVVTVLALHTKTLQAQADAEAWRAEAQKQEQEQNRLEEMLNNLGTLEGIKDIAENFLGLVDPDTIIINPEN
jgi:cell division protein FtsL